jgi:hypothetical protein
LQQELGKTDDSPKHCLMIKNIVTVGGVQYPPIFKPFIHGLLPVLHPLFHRLHSWIWIFQQTTGTFYLFRYTPTVATIRLTPLVLLQIFGQCIFKNYLVVPIAGRERPMPPANLTRLDAEGYLVAAATLLKFVAIKGLLIAHRDLEVCSVN